MNKYYTIAHPNRIKDIQKYNISHMVIYGTYLYGSRHNVVTSILCLDEENAAIATLCGLIVRSINFTKIEKIVHNSYFNRTD